MPAISNDYHRCEMLNLGTAPGGRGPFVIRQEGSAPGSMTMRQEIFLLRRDGVWVINLVALSLSEKEQEQFLYETSVEVLKTLDGLPRDSAVDDKLPEGASREQLMAGIETTASRILGGLRNARAVNLR